jgi:hypothetical protein
LITITRSFLRHLRAVLRRALRITGRDAGPNLLFITGADGLRIQTRNTHAAVEHHTTGDFPAERICVPFALLTDCEGTKAEPVNLEQEPGGKIVARWTDNKIPQVVQYDSRLEESPILPVVPSAMAENDAGLWPALADAMEIAVTDSARYALTCIQLRSEGGRIVATDGHQLLVQRGFDFPWEGDVLIFRSTLFACKELPADGPLRIGKSDEWLVLQTGPWSFHLAIDKDRRFPKTEDFVRRPETASTRLTLAPGDADFLADAIQRLPCEADDCNQSVTLDLNGKVLVRARSSDSKVPTELVLSRSETSGEDLRFAINRKYLARALKLGLRELCMYGKEVPAQAVGENRDYIWAMLSGDTAIKPSNKAVRIDSCNGSSQTADETATATTVSPPVMTASTLPASSTPTANRSVHTMTKSNRFQTPSAIDENGNGSANGSNGSANGSNGSANGNNGNNGHASVVSEPADLIDQAEMLRSTLRTAASQASELIAALKQQKRTARSVQSALATLRQLDRVAM